MEEFTIPHTQDPPACNGGPELSSRSRTVRYYQDFLVRDWQPEDREAAFEVIRSVLAEYGLGCEPEGADRDVLQVEACYWQTRGEFWVIERQQRIVGTAGYYPLHRDPTGVELRKMYLLPEVRGLGLGRFLLGQLESAIAARGFNYIRLETARVLRNAVYLYEKSGYQPVTGVETPRCDLVYVKLLNAA